MTGRNSSSLRTEPDNLRKKSGPMPIWNSLQRRKKTKKLCSSTPMGLCQNEKEEGTLATELLAITRERRSLKPVGPWVNTQKYSMWRWWDFTWWQLKQDASSKAYHQTVDLTK